MRCRIGYGVDRPDFSHPGDRRRFAWYLRQRGRDPERPSPDGDYDLLYFSLRCDLARWIDRIEAHRRRHPGTRVLFDIADAYLADDRPVRDVARGLLQFATGKSPRPVLSFQRLLRQAIAVSDVVMCGSPEQQRILRELHPNVHFVTDAFWDDVPVRKLDYAGTAGEVHVAWEGLSHGNEQILAQLGEILVPFNREYRVYVHVISDARFCRYSGRFGCTETTTLLDRVFGSRGIRPLFYSWHPRTFAAVAARCDLALLPIPDDPIMQLKPENKLLLLWMVGLPVVAQATPAYQRTMETAGLSASCDTPAAWDREVGRLIESAAAREAHMTLASSTLTGHYSSMHLLTRWDAALASVGCSASQQ